MTAHAHDDDINFDQPLAPVQPLERDPWAPIRLTQLPDQPPVKPTLGSVGLVYPGKRHMFSGPPESAKTLAAYAILIEIVRQDATGVLIDFEMGGYDSRQRFRELGATDQEIDRILYVEPDEPATEERISKLVHLKPAVVVIDSALGAYTLHGLNDSDRGDIEKLTTLLVTPFWRAGIATIVIDHVVKDAEQRGRYAIGSERKLGGVDVALGFETILAVSRGTTGRYKVVTNKDRGAYLKRGHVADLHVASDPETHRVTITFTTPEVVTDHDGTFKFDLKMEQVSRKLETLTDPVSGNDLYGMIGGNKKAFLSAVADLVSAGYARRIGGPTSPIEFVKQFRRDEAVPTGSEVVPEPAGTTGSHGSSPYGVEPWNREPNEPLPGLGWFQDDGTFTPSDLSYLESIAPDEADA